MLSVAQAIRSSMFVNGLLWKGRSSVCVCLRRLYSSRNILRLEERGLWSDIFPPADHKLINRLISEPQTVYSGFDPTADSLHVGNLLVIMALIHCQRAGHNVIALIGGATGQVGDPSGRSTERPLIDTDYVHQNANKIAENIHRMFENHKQYFWDTGHKEPLPPVRTVNNAEWHKNLSVVEFLRVAGHNLRMGDLLKRTSVQSRLTSEGLSFSEFSYQALQAYDWLHLYDKYKCSIQIGGSDQMGNMHSGYQLVSKVRGASVTGLALPLITNESGNKFGKSAGNPIWLDSNKTSPFDLYQFFMRLKDSEIEKYLLLFTFLPIEDVKSIMHKQLSKPENRHAHTKLAEKVTLLVHGPEGLESAQRTTRLLYGNQSEVLAEMTRAEIESAFGSASCTSLLLEPGTTVLSMAMKAGCFGQEKDGRRITEAGGLYINQARVTNPDLILIPGAHILNNGLTVVRVGKKNYYLINWV